MLTFYIATTLGATLLLLLIWQQRHCWRFVWQLNGWRGVAQQPLLWLFLLLCLEPKSILEGIIWLREYLPRPLAIVVGTRTLLYVDDPQTMACIYNAPECLDKTFMQDGFFARRGLLHAKGQKWKLRRKQLNPAFNQSVLLSCFDTFNAVGNRLRQKFAAELLCSCNDDVAVGYAAVEDLLSRAVLEISCLTTMGTATNFTEHDEKDIAKMYKKLLELSTIKIVKPWFQIDGIFRLLDRANYERSQRCNAQVEAFVRNIVKRKHDAWQERSKASDENEIAAGNVAADDDDAGASAAQRRIFIEQIFHLADAGELSLQDIMDEANSMVLVSFETISNSLTIALLCLAANPTCQTGLRAEISATLQRDNAADVATLSAQQLQQMKYLDMCVNESLRLLATVPINSRHVSKEFRMQSQAQPRRRAVVPQNTIVVLDVFNMQRDRLHWGARAQQFHPEHFAQADNAAPRHPYAFVPFSKGLRSCIGWRYSMLLLKLLLVKLVAHFEFRTDTKLAQLRFVEGISLKFAHCDRIRFQIRRI